MKIGFDLDKVFIDYPPFIPDYLIERLYKKKDNGELLYRMPSVPEQMIRKVSHLSLFRPPIKKNIAYLNEISGQGHNLYLISSRFKFLKNETRYLMKKHHFDTLFDKMFFNYDNLQPHHFKNDLLQKLQLDMYIDDDLSLLTFISTDNQATKLFWLAEEKKHKDVVPPIFAIADLSCILKKDYA